MFSPKGKLILSIVCVVCLVSSVFLGVGLAKQVSTLTFGEGVDIENLDTPEPVGMVNVLVMGTDDGGQRSDTMMIVSMNGHTGQVNILSIPRDTRVKIGNSYQKINAAIGIGAQEVQKGNLKEPEELPIEKVKLLTGLPIHYFATVDLDGFKAIIDALGGVDYNIPYHMDYDDPTQDLHIHFEPGMQHLDGQAAHDYVRFRHNNDMTAPGLYAMGDEGRIQAQQEFLKELARQKLQPQYLTKINELFKVIQEHVRTNYTALDLAKHINLIKNIDPNTIQTFQLPGSAQYINGVSYYICDETATAEMVDQYFQPDSPAATSSPESGEDGDSTAQEDSTNES